MMKRYKSFLTIILVLITNAIISNQTAPKHLPLFSSYQLDTKIKQTLYCGTKSLTSKVVLLTEKGNVLISINNGFTWNVIDEIIEKTGRGRIDKPDDKVGVVRKIIQSDNNRNVLFFLGTEEINWISNDCGVTLTAFNQGRPIEDLIFNPIDPRWIIATAFTQPEDEQELTYKELFYSTDGGYSWKFLIDFVVQVAWGSVDYNNVEYGVPKQRIIITRHQDESNIKENNLDLIYSDDYFMTPVIGLKLVENFVLAGDSLYVSKIELKEKENDVTVEKIINNKQGTNTLKQETIVNASSDKNKNKNKEITKLIVEHNRTLVLMYASIKHFTYHFEKAVFNSHPDLAHLHYNFLTISDTIVLNVNHYTEAGTVGDVYITNKQSKFFGHSIQHNVKQEVDGEIDFAHIAGINGTFIVNTIENNIESTSELKNYHSSKQEYSHYRIVTRITFNNGVSWHKLIPPSVDSNGQPYANCNENYRTQRCNLHLSGITNSRSEFISKKNAIGMILSNGNVGNNLNININLDSNGNNISENTQEINLFLSRDGGLSWKEIKKGEQVFNIGDHGGIIVVAPKHTPTTTISYSIDEGNTFVDSIVTPHPILVDKISVINDSLFFLIQGVNPNNGIGVVIATDFERVFERKCEGANFAGRETSDYELWTPHDLESGNVGYECLMGEKNTYIRRKPEKKCFNGMEFEIKTSSETCNCLETDFECDLGYKRYGNMGPCVKVFDHPLVNVKDSNGCVSVATRGYIKIPGNKCHGGVDLSPIVKNCDQNYDYEIVYLFVTFLIIAIAVVVSIYIRNFLKHERKSPVNNSDKYLELRNMELNRSQQKMHNTVNKGLNASSIVYNSESGSDSDE